MNTLFISVPLAAQDEFLASDTGAEVIQQRRGPGQQGVQYRSAAEDANAADPETSAAAAATLAKVTPCALCTISLVKCQDLKCLQHAIFDWDRVFLSLLCVRYAHDALPIQLI